MLVTVPIRNSQGCAGSGRSRFQLDVSQEGRGLSPWQEENPQRDKMLGASPTPQLPYLSSDLWISAIFLSSFSECLGKNWNLEL